MLPFLLLLLFAAPQGAGNSPAKAAAVDDGPSYTASGEMVRPENYREWVFLTSGVDMSYSDSAAAPARSVFDNVFVNPSAYRAFLKSGTWPDKTVLVLEVRGAEGAASINKRGHTQSPEVRGIEVHVKDSSKEGVWTFYGFGSTGAGKPFPRTASCYTCHQEHGIVDTTFVQFYPTLLPLAKDRGTIRPDLLKELEPVAAPAAGSPASSK